ncbi:MAG: hypothetical protein WCS77_04055 [Elusimicrobiaceae bacterium]
MPFNENTVKEICAQLGTDLAGIASARLFNDAPRGFRPEDLLSSCRAVIALACEFSAEAMRQMECFSHAFKFTEGTLEIQCWQCRKICPNHAGIAGL